MIRKLIILSCILLGIFSVFGCQPIQEDTADDNHANQESAIGHDNRLELLTKHDFGYYGVPTFIIRLVEEEKWEKWKMQFEGSTPGGRCSWEANISNAVLELNVSKEAFIKANNGFSYTDEEIEAIYSGDPKIINRVFVNEHALLVNDEIYTADWLASRTTKDYEKAGITEEILHEYLNKINAIDFKDEYRAIKGTLRKSKQSMSLPIDDFIGDFSKLELLAPYRYPYYGIDSFLYEIIDRAKMTEWMDQFIYQYNYRNIRPVSECNVINLVKELNVPKEDFIKANNGLIYTPEEIEAIYSGSQRQINDVFVNEYALIVNDKVYTADWLATYYKVQDYEKEGITKEALGKYLNKINNVPQLKPEFEKINIEFKKMMK